METSEITENQPRLDESPLAVPSADSFAYRRELWIAVVISGLSLAISFGLAYFSAPLPRLMGWPLDPAWLAVLLCGLPIIREAARAMWKSFDVKAGLLISLALIAAISIKEIFAAGEVAFLMMLGELLEERTVRRAKAGLERLLKLSPQMARVIEGGMEKMLPVIELKVGQIVQVRPGESIPVDGLIIKGATTVDQSAITGESLPMDRLAGDQVFSGTLNLYGAVEIEAQRVGADSSLGRLIHLVAEADSQKARLARTADRWATVIVPLALVMAIVVGLYTGDVIRAVSILIVFCPCGLVLATPTAIVAAIGAATKRGLLVRSGEALENLASVTHMAFDKTGTLTRGELKLGGIKSFGPTDDELLALAASVEQQSEHPLGQALLKAAREKGLIWPLSDDFAMTPGLGARATVYGRELLAGRLLFIERHGLRPSLTMLKVENELLEAGQAVVWVAQDGAIKGILGLTDSLRPESASLVADLKKAGLKILLLTGDHERAALNIARSLGLDDVRSGLMPEDKVNAIKAMTKAGHKVAMIGDGLNDAPALKSATVGLAMGDVGIDVTIEAADVALISGNLKALPWLFRLSRQTLSTIHLNISLAMGINLAAVVLAALGIMGPILSALVHNLGAVAVVLNAARLYNFK